MACLDMYNSEHKGHNHHHQHHCSSISPRISFSNDFVDAQQAIKQELSSRSDAPAVSSDFEFSVTNYSMMSADELFFKGRLLPFKDNCKKNKGTTTTLREELLVDEGDEFQEFSPRPPKGSSTKWKGFLGLRKSQIGSKKVDKSEGSSDRGVEARRSGLINEGIRPNMTSQRSCLMKEGQVAEMWRLGYRIVSEEGVEFVEEWAKNFLLSFLFSSLLKGVRVGR